MLIMDATHLSGLFVFLPPLLSINLHLLTGCHIWFFWLGPELFERLVLLWQRGGAHRGVEPVGGTEKAVAVDVPNIQLLLPFL